MPMTKEQILAEAKSLSPTDREALAEELWLTLTTDDQSAIDAAWLEECHRRIAAVDRGEVTTIPAEEAMREAREAVRRSRQ
jgi:putative addiction module component (TIGR02574 family)